MCSYENGLKADSIRVDETDDAVRCRIAELFKYDDCLVPNPAGPMQLFSPCTLSYFGLCKKDFVIDAVSMVIKNLYNKHSGGKVKFPIALACRLPGKPRREQQTVFLTKLIGQGAGGLVLKLARVDQVDDSDIGSLYEMDEVPGRSRFAPLTLHVFFSRLITVQSDELDTRVADVDGVIRTCLVF